MVIRVIEEEYWSVQYMTRVSGYRDPTWWPPDGEGKFDTESDALAAMERTDAMAQWANNSKLRTLHVVHYNHEDDPE